MCFVGLQRCDWIFGEGVVADSVLLLRFGLCMWVLVLLFVIVSQGKSVDHGKPFGMSGCVSCHSRMGWVQHAEAGVDSNMRIAHGNASLNGARTSLSFGQI